LIRRTPVILESSNHESPIATTAGSRRV
jgi:hypothetical protein